MAFATESLLPLAQPNKDAHEPAAHRQRDTRPRIHYSSPLPQIPSTSPAKHRRVPHSPVCSPCHFLQHVWSHCRRTDCELQKVHIRGVRIQLSLLQPATLRISLCVHKRNLGIAYPEIHPGRRVSKEYPAYPQWGYLRIIFTSDFLQSNRDAANHCFCSVVPDDSPDWFSKKRGRGHHPSGIRRPILDRSPEAAFGVIWHRNITDHPETNPSA